MTSLDKGKTPVAPSSCSGHSEAQRNEVQKEQEQANDQPRTGLDRAGGADRPGRRKTRLDPNGPTIERLAKLPGVTIRRRASGHTSVSVAKDAKLIRDDGVVRINAEQLDRLRSRETLAPTDAYRNEQLYQAGDLLRQHWYRGTLGDSLRSMDLNGAGGGGNGHPAWMTPSCESVAYHRVKFRAVRDQMDRDHFAIVFAVCCGDSTLGRPGAMPASSRRTPPGPLRSTGCAAGWNGSRSSGA